MNVSQESPSRFEHPCCFDSKEVDASRRRECWVLFSLVLVRVSVRVMLLSIVEIFCAVPSPSFLVLLVVAPSLSNIPGEIIQ